MHRRRTVSPLAVALIIVAGLAGCSDDPTGPEATPFAITGTVTDADGNPVADAVVLLDLAVEPVGKAAGMPPTTVVNFFLPDAGPVQITMLSSCRADTFHHQELDLDGGAHTIPVTGTDADDRQLTDQDLWIAVATPDATIETRILLLRNAEGEDGDYGQWDHAYVRDHVRIQATTDAEGWYTIDPCIGFGAVFTARNEMGVPIGEERIAWRVRAWAYHADHPDGTPSIWRDLDPDTGGFVSVIMGD